MFGDLEDCEESMRFGDIEATIIQTPNGVEISNIKIRERRRGTIEDRQIRAYERAHEHIDNQPHMTLSPEKHGKLWLDGKHHGHPNQTPTILSPKEAFRMGFHNGARWGRADALYQIRKKKKG